MRLLRSTVAFLAALPFVVAALLAGCTRTGPAGTESPGAAPQGQQSPLTLDEGKRLAAERGVPLLVDFWSPT